MLAASLIPLTAICETGSINVLKRWRLAEPWYRSQKGYNVSHSTVSKLE
jgi:hypothetical protein